MPHGPIIDSDRSAWSSVQSSVFKEKAPCEDWSDAVDDRVLTGQTSYFVGFTEPQLIFVPEHDKTNKTTYVPSKDSDQPGHLPIFLLCTLRIAKAPRLLHADSKDSDQTGWMPRLISLLGVQFILLVLTCPSSYFMHHTYVLDGSYRYDDSISRKCNSSCRWVLMRKRMANRNTGTSNISVMHI